MKLTILLESGSKEITAQPGQTILDAVRAQEGLPVHAPCGGQGTCGKCTVYLSGPEGETAVLSCRTPVMFPEMFHILSRNTRPYLCAETVSPQSRR